jgi:hypothetical protein
MWTHKDLHRNVCGNFIQQTKTRNNPNVYQKKEKIFKKKKKKKEMSSEPEKNVVFPRLKLTGKQVQRLACLLPYPLSDAQ